MLYFDPKYYLFLAPGILLAMWAQHKIRSTYATAMQMPARLSGAAAARHVLDSAGLQSVEIEMLPDSGNDLDNHYDPRDKVLRLSPRVYQSNTLAAVGIAAHEAGHAMQDATGYSAMQVRNAAVGLAGPGATIGMALLPIGVIAHMPLLIWAGILLFSATVFFQLVNLPVEFNASTRGKQELVRLGIVDSQELGEVRSVLDAAAWTYVAGTLQVVLMLLYWVMQATSQRAR
jgi:Zn-dependent membrane protease YugP